MSASEAICKERIGRESTKEIKKEIPEDFLDARGKGTILKRRNVSRRRRAQEREESCKNWEKPLGKGFRKKRKGG